MKPKKSILGLRSSLLATAALSSSSLAGNVSWDGSGDNDWNNPDNWDAGRVPSKAFDFDNAIINTLTNFPVITTDLAVTPADIKIGTGGGTTGQVDQRAGIASAGDGNWSVIGEFGGSGTFNLADTSATGGALTGFGTGSGAFTTRRLYVAREGTGNMSVNTSGSVKVFNDMYVGEGGTGTLKWDAGTLNRNGDGGWMVIGKDGGGNDGNGIFEIGGGTFNAANDTIVGLDSGSTGQLNQSGGTYNAGGIWVGRGGGTGTWTVSGTTTQLNSTGEVSIGRESGSNGTLQVNGGTVAVNNWFNVGRDGGTGAFNMTGGTLTVERELRIGFGGGGTGSLQLSGGAKITAATVSEHIVIGGDGGSGTATVSGSGTELNSTNELRVGNNNGSSGELTVSGGTVTTGSWLGIGRDGANGSLTISGDAVVDQGLTDPNSRLELTNNNKPSTATLSLDGGELIVNGFANNGGGTTNIFLNGGLITATLDNDSFLQGMTAVTIEAGGAKFDTDGSNIAINQPLSGLAGDGGLLKSGFGALRLNGANTYTGTTTVTGGEIAGTGSISGPLLVQDGGTVAPGAPVGTFTAGSTTIAGNYACEINGSNNDMLAVNGALDLSAATDNLSFSLPGAGATKPVYIIASYTSLTGTFGSVNNLPPGYSLTYSLDGGNQIAITRPLTPYESWLETRFPGETDTAIIGLDADPDGDGQPNKIEFALGGNPDDPADNARVYQLLEDSEDGGTQRELLLTIAVPDGTPAFAGTPSPAATFGGVTCTIAGSLDLTTFTSPVSLVSPVTTGLPPAPAGYEYRTFSLDGSDGLPSKGFMRVEVLP